MRNMHPVTRLVAASAIAASAALCVSASARPLPLTGVNLAGAEFNGQSFWPNQSEVEYFQAAGMNIVRIPFLWERMQPQLYGPLDAEQIDSLGGIVASATASGVHVIIDPHNYARYGGSVLGSFALPVSTFQDLWFRLASRFRNNPRVIFGLMNEPHSMQTESWLASANAGIEGIRSADAPQLILVPGNGWTGAWSWQDSFYGTPNAMVMGGVVDPLDNYAYELHQYFDHDHSGTSPECIHRSGAALLQDVTSWLRSHGKRGFLAEVGVSTDPGCAAALESTLGYMEQNADVWFGWTWWAAGPAWPDNYMFNLEPLPGSTAERVQLTWLRPYLPPADPIFRSGFE